MKMRRGTPSDRFEQIVEVYGAVAKDTKHALKTEEEIMDAYNRFPIRVEGGRSACTGITRHALAHFGSLQGGIGRCPEGTR